MNDKNLDERYFNATARNFNEIAMGIFGPMYPVLAEQIIDECGITNGVCIDGGSGPAQLAIELAKRTNLKVFILDICKEMQEIADYGKN